MSETHTTDLPTDALAGDTRGTVLEPGDDGYDDARSVWNAMVDREPALVLRCAGTADVRAGVQFARDHDCPLGVKSGGHHVSGSAVPDSGLLLDLGPMDWVTVDADAQTARVGPGATWGDVDHETQAFGLAVPGGQDPNIGVAGLTLGGGVGWLSRLHGLTSDNLRSATVVTAAGDVVRASDDENEALFWALRGGGGHFGVVTAFEFDLHPVGPEIFAGSLVYPHDEFAAVARRYREFMQDAPREVRLLFGSMMLPDSTAFPPSVRTERVAMLICCYAGPPEQGREVLEPLRSAGDPVADTLRPRPYREFQQAGDSQGAMRTHLRSNYLWAVSDPAIDTVADIAQEAPSAGATVFMSPRSGAETDPPVDATAYPHRADTHHILVESRWTDPDEDDRHVEWTEAAHEALQPHATGQAALNFLTADESKARVRAAYGENWDRLVEIKQRWDPDDLFSSTQPVDPADGG